MNHLVAHTSVQYGLKICCLASNTCLRHPNDTLWEGWVQLLLRAPLCSGVSWGNGSVNFCQTLSVGSHTKWHFSVPGITHSFHSPVHVTTWFHLWEPAVQGGANSCRSCPQTLFLAPSLWACSSGAAHLCAECWWHMTLLADHNLLLSIIEVGFPTLPLFLW